MLYAAEILSVAFIVTYFYLRLKLFYASVNPRNCNSRKNMCDAQRQTTLETFTSGAGARHERRARRRILSGTKIASSGNCVARGFVIAVCVSSAKAFRLVSVTTRCGFSG
jgi:hypothetical protein